MHFFFLKWFDWKKKVKQKQPKLTNVVQKYNTVDRVLNITSRLLAHVVGVTL